MTIEQYQQDITPLRGTWGQAWAGAHGALKDALVERARQAVLAGAITRTPADGLARLGADADLERVPSESGDAWRDRIAGAWESWSWAGTPYGITLSVGLLGYGYPSVWSYRQLPPDSNVTRWARVLVYFRGLPAWDAGGIWDGEGVWDDARDADAIEAFSADTVRPQLRRVLRQWVNARDVVDRVVIAFGSLLWDLDSLWDGEDLWDEGDGETVWQSPEWDSAEEGALWDAPLMAWDAFC